MKFEAKIDEYLQKKINEFWRVIPYAKHLLSDSMTLNESYYTRHRIETILRIRLTSKLDCIALSKIIEQDYDAAREWGLYTIQEMNHDKMFINDLHKHGINSGTILSTEPFPSTKKMVEYLIEETNYTSSGLPAVCYSLFVEWNADRFSKQVVRRLEAHYTEKHVLGAKRHMEFDEKHDHYSQILNLVQKLSEDIEQVRILLEKIHDFFCQYFLELYEATILGHNHTKV